MLDQKLKEIHRRVSQDLEINKDLPASFKNILSIALSGLTYTIIEQLKNYEELLPDKATSEQLDSWGKVYGVPRKEATKAVINVFLTCDKDIELKNEEFIFLNSKSQGIYESFGVIEKAK